MWCVCDVQYAVLYVRVNCFVVRGCAVQIVLKPTDLLFWQASHADPLAGWRCS